MNAPRVTPTTTTRSMRSPTSLLDTDRAHLRLYLLLNLSTVLGASIGLVVLRFTIVRSNWLLVDAAAVFAVAVALLAALHLLAAGRVGLVLTVLTFANWSVSIVTVLITPFILPTIVLAVLLPLVATLPYLSRRRLLATAIGAIACSTVVGIVSRLRLVDGPQQIASPALRTGIVVCSIPVVMTLIVLNVWRGHLGLIDRSNELRQSRARIAAAADETRRRLERDLHDGAQQRLSAVAIRLALARGQLDAQPAVAAALLAELDQELIEAIDELRDLARGIYPSLLGQRGLGEALRAAARRGTIPVTVNCSAVGRYSPDVEAAVYFSCLEALHNATKHANPSTIDVTVRHGARLEFAVVDDGVGFDPKTVQLGAGLTNVADRLGSIGGQLTIRSAPGVGTQIGGSIATDATAVVLAPPLEDGAHA